METRKGSALGFESRKSFVLFFPMVPAKKSISRRAQDEVEERGGCEIDLLGFGHGGDVAFLSGARPSPFSHSPRGPVLIFQDLCLSFPFARGLPTEAAVVLDMVQY